MSFIKIIIYSTPSGKSPFREWQSKLDLTVQAIVDTRIDRIRLGNFGDSKPLSNASGLRELRISVGPGYRVYFGMRGNAIVVLLAGGDKKTQISDIAKAKKYWEECKGLL